MNPINQEVIVLLVCSVWLEISGFILIYLSRKGYHPFLGIIGKVICILSPMILLVGAWTFS